MPYRLRRMPVLLILLLATVAPASAQLLFSEGAHYDRIEEPVPTPDGVVQVTEFFSYGCGHCNDFEPHLVTWKQSLPENVEFRLVPAGLGRGIFQQLAAIHYIADELGVLDEAHGALFAEIQEKQNRAIMSREGLTTFFGQYGVAPEAVDAAIQAPAVQERFQAGELEARAVGLSGVPLLVVNGKYRVMRNQHVTSYEQMLEVVDFLVAQEAAE